MIAEIVGSSSIAIRTHQAILAEVALQKGLSRTTKERETLQQLAAGVPYLDVL